MAIGASLSRPVVYVTDRGELVAGVITAVFALNRVNIALFPDGVNQAHLSPHAYTVDYAEPEQNGTDPEIKYKPNSWHAAPHTVIRFNV